MTPQNAAIVVSLVIGSGRLALGLLSSAGRGNISRSTVNVA